MKKYKKWSKLPSSYGAIGFFGVCVCVSLRWYNFASVYSEGQLLFIATMRCGGVNDLLNEIVDTADTTTGIE